MKNQENGLLISSVGKKKGPLVISGTLLMLHQEEHTELSLHKFASSTREIFVSYDSAI